MKSPQPLEDLPNIGKSIASDLRAIGVLTPAQLRESDPLTTYFNLAKSMGKRRDPCVLYTLMAVKHFLVTGEKLAWWKFTEQGKTLLNSNRQPHKTTALLRK
ncbi:MAG: helix-hairpin-helix domain-containing protein [Gallionellaceae bacterium]|nr:helix-hairpin-helix domain-containing protein [Gallionellaceae bacterium]